MSEIMHNPVPQHQAEADLSQAAPSTGNKYTVLDTTKNVRLIRIMVQVTWTVQPTPLEIHLTIDGQTYAAEQGNPVSAQVYYLATFDHHITGSTMALTSRAEAVRGGSFICEGKSVKVEAETTGGTVSNLSARVVYAKL